MFEGTPFPLGVLRTLQYSAPVRLLDFYRYDPRVLVIPGEQLSPVGMTPEYARELNATPGWSDAHTTLFDRGFEKYWTRTSQLAACSPHWQPPRLRNIVIARERFAVHPYISILNTSSWTLFTADFDPASSDSEFVAYLLVHGDRMARTGEVTLAALRNAAYWFDRTNEECAAFVRAAGQSSRPDADGFRATAADLDSLRGLFEDRLRPPPVGIRIRTIPTTGLSVPSILEAGPPALVDAWTAAARSAVVAYQQHWAGTDLSLIRQLCDWLAEDGPELLIVAKGGRVLWDSDSAQRVNPLRNELKNASRAAVAAIHADLQVVNQHTKSFLQSLTDPSALPSLATEAEQRGYVFMHAQRRLIAYNLHEPGIDRLHGPDLPFARAMLGARVIHEWAHLAVDAGFVPCRNATELESRLVLLADRLKPLIAAAPSPWREETAADVGSLGSSNSAATTLAETFRTRLPDFQANLLSQRYLNIAERETYVRQNIRTLRAEYGPQRRWRMLIRYLYEFQYLRFSEMPDPMNYFLRSTWFDTDFFATGILTPESFADLCAVAAAVCDTFVVDESRFRGAFWFNTGSSPVRPE